ncbi:uncharacterized protein LOC102707202 isoform X2 [Oryza brachyantha]|uniref:uncharacterized protein LOC102707202 isoform X2 n=1 Tax=Oryza brachyantha TaxID=4533 RepID=UPI0007764BE7|nr:uncharacterized protein LOC102707202 isoform X2 [Oryza brachyantha]
MLWLKRFMAGRRRQRRRRRGRQRAAQQPHNGSITKRKETPCQQDNQGDKRLKYSEPDLPEHMWWHIHSLLPLRDAARVACVSRVFLRSWRCHPNLIFITETLGLEPNAGRQRDRTRAFTSIVNHILKNHSGNGIKTLNLQLYDYPDINPCDLNNWLQNAIKPWIEEITLGCIDCKYIKMYNFPCSLLFGENGRSLRYLDIHGCAFRPTVGLRLRSLRQLCLYYVCITGDELWCLLTNSFALKELELSGCSEIICLKVPPLEQLSHLNVFSCKMLQMIEMTDSNISTFNFIGSLPQFSVGQLSKVKDLDMECSNKSNFLFNAITRLPCVAPNVESLVLFSISEMVDTPMVAAKFLHLKYLDITLSDANFSPEYDYLSLVHFLDACPVLETFILSERMKHVSVFGDASLPMRQMTEHKKHKSLKHVMMLGFCSAKSLVELTCCILEKATSLECITLDTINNWYSDESGIINRCSDTSNTRKCLPIGRKMILEAHRALLAIERYIVGKVPSAVRLDVLRPCTRCHTV